MNEANIVVFFWILLTGVAGDLVGKAAGVDAGVLFGMGGVPLFFILDRWVKRLELMLGNSSG